MEYSSSSKYSTVLPLHWRSVLTYVTTDTNVPLHVACVDGERRVTWRVTSLLTQLVLRLGPANGALRKLSQSKECESSASGLHLVHLVV